jgi:hypothetical protein
MKQEAGEMQTGEVGPRVRQKGGKGENGMKD